VLFALAPIIASGLKQAWLDPVRPPVPMSTTRPDWPRQRAALVWLELRQASRLVKWLPIAGLVAGPLLALGISFWPLLPLVGWPVLTLLLGVSTGVAVFAGEQAEGTGRFLGEQRLPPGMVWAVKVGLHLTLAVSVAVVLFLSAQGGLGIWEMLGEHGQAELTAFDILGPFLQWGPYFTLFLGYGFSFGCLCGLLFSKRVVAGFIASGASLLLVMLWVPSLLVGGLYLWQVWGVPILLLFTVRLLLWPWATGRLASGSAVMRLAIGLGLAGLWLAAGIG